jgi:hypothetical protein
MTDIDAILNPPREPSPRVMARIDRLSLLFPALSAVLSAFAGSAALIGATPSAALLSIVAGCISAAGVFFTSWAWKVRDGRQAVAHALAGAALEEANRNASTSTY